MTIKQFNNIDKPLTSGGRETPPLNMQQFIKLADTEKYEFDALNEKLELLKDAWIENRRPGETYDSWFKRTPREEIIRITAKEGGRVIKFSDYKKPKIKTINLSDYFDMGRRLIDLTQIERDTLKWLLNKSLYKKD